MKAIDNLTALGSRATVAFAPLLAQLFDRPRQRDQDFDATDARRLIEALAATAPDAASRANVLLKALRQRDIRSGHELKNSWFMRDVLEDLLLANLPATTTGLRNALKDESVEVRQSAALVLARAGLDVARTVPILVEQCSNGQALDQEATRFHGRMVECLMRREHHSAELIAATWCNAWKSAPARVRSLLEPGLLVLQPEALPHLLEQLRQAKATQARRDLAHLLARFEGQSQVVLPILRAELGDAQLPAQYAAVQALRLLGADAAEAVPDLLRLLHHTHPGMRGLAVQALAGVGPAARPAVPALKALLKAKQLGLRLVAADALSQIDPSVSEALVVLREMFIELKRENSNLDVRLELPRGLSDRDVDHEAIEERLARYGERGIAVLAEILENVDLDEWSADNLSAQGGNPARVQAALLLARLGPEAKSAVPALRRALKDRDPFVREAAASALGRIGPAAREAAPDLLVLLEQEHRAGATGGAWSSTPRLGSPIDNSRSFDFRSLGRNARLERARNHHSGYYFDNVDPYHRIQAVHPHDAVSVLSRIDGEALSALPILRGIAKTSNHPGRLAAGLALWRSGDGADDLVAAFTDTLARHARSPQDDVAALPREVLDVLAEPDAPLKPAVRVMSEWLKRREESASDHDQAAVATALGRCGTAARAAEEVFRSMLKTRSWAVRRRVAVCLALYRITGDSKSAFPILREALLSAEERFTLYYRPERSDAPRVHAARALGVLADAGDETARRLLAETMKGDENLHVRLAALEATARHQDTTAAAERGLCALLRHPDAGVREATAMACGRLGARAKACLAALRTATQDGQLAVRQTARHALERLE